MTQQNFAAQAAVLTLMRPVPTGELGPSDEPDSAYKLGYNNAIEDAVNALPKVRAEGVQAGDERAAFEADYAKAWNAAYKNKTSHTAEEVAALREADGCGEENVYLNARWQALASPCRPGKRPCCPRGA
jgi:hypothetical protein